MRLLLDTHLFLWCVTDDRQFSKAIKSKILNAYEVYISSASILEMTIKIKIKKLDADVNGLVKAISKSSFTELPITVNHAASVFQLADIHRDPFDRILIAQAISEPLTLLTADVHLRNYSDLIEVVE